MRKPLAAFVKEARARDGRGSHCKECDVERVMEKRKEAEYATLRFDYQEIAVEHRQTVQDASLEILAAGRRAKENIVTMGQKLIDVKAILPEGTFMAWIAKEFELSDRMARNFMNVAREYGDRVEIISVLNDTVLYLLAAPSTPEAARAEVEAIAVTEGKSPKVARVQRIVKAHKPEPERNSDPTPPDLAAAGYKVALYRDTDKWTWNKPTGVLDDMQFGMPHRKIEGAIEDARHHLFQHTPQQIPPDDAPSADELAAIAIVEAERVMEDDERAERDIKRANIVADPDMLLLPISRTDARKFQLALLRGGRLKDIYTSEEMDRLNIVLSHLLRGMEEAKVAD